MSVGTRQFVLPPDSKSSFLHGGRIASVIRELQGGDKEAKCFRSSVIAEESSANRVASAKYPRPRDRENITPRDKEAIAARELITTLSRERETSRARESFLLKEKEAVSFQPKERESLSVERGEFRPNSFSRDSESSVSSGVYSDNLTSSSSSLGSTPPPSLPPTVTSQPVSMGPVDLEAGGLDDPEIAENAHTRRHLEDQLISDNASLDLSISFSESEEEEKPSPIPHKISEGRVQARPAHSRLPMEAAQTGAAPVAGGHEFGTAPGPGPQAGARAGGNLVPAQQAVPGFFPGSTQEQLSNGPDYSAVVKKSDPTKPRSSTAQNEPHDPKKGIRSSKPEGYVGFGSLPDQVYRKAVRKGFEFNLMVVGESGLGKSTLVNSMFLTDIYSSSFDSTSSNRTLEVETHTVVLEEGGVKLSLTVVDTPGFGDAVDNTGCWLPVTEYIENQFDKFLEAEQRVHRVQLIDSRVHACLYFVAPNGHGLRQLDIEAMKHLHDKVNVIPVIGKSDACTQQEIRRFKSAILRQLNEQNINIYDFPLTEDPQVDWMREQLPFAVVGSNTIIEDEDGRRVRGRSYPWGTVNIEDRQHCDFTALRTLLLSHHMQDLKDVTNSTHYETYRCRKLTSSLDCAPPPQPQHRPPPLPVIGGGMHQAIEDTSSGRIEEANEGEERREMAEVGRRRREEREEASRMRREEGEEMRSRSKEPERDSTWSNSKNLRYRQQSVESLTGKKKRYGLEKIAFRLGRTIQ